MANKRTKKQTLSEFQAWLSGVEELQPDDWAPDASQWALIRNKINSIIEPKEQALDADAVQKLIAGINNSAGMNTPKPTYAGNPYQAPAAAFIPPAPPVGGIPDGPIEVAPAAQEYVQLKPAPRIDIVDVAKPKDTGDGKYNSGFV